MKLVIIESPYAGDIARNATYARAALRHSLDLGEAPLASHLLYTQVLDDSSPTERATGIRCGHEWFRHADLVAFYEDFGWTEGMRAALTAARELSIPIESRHLYYPDGYKGKEDDYDWA